VNDDIDEEADSDIDEDLADVDQGPDDSWFDPEPDIKDEDQEEMDDWFFDEW
jgi:hypothetical protein